MSFFLIDSIDNELLFFRGQTASHISRSLRKNIGDEIVATDGVGNIFKGLINDIGKDIVVAEIISKEKRSHDIQVTIACSVLKKDRRFENFVEKATEVGVQTIIPLLCKHSIKEKVNMDRLNKIMISAAQQSMNANHPRISDVIPFDDFIRNPPEEYEERFIGYAPDRNRNKSLEELYKGSRSVCVVIGPEGDFSKEELAAAIDAGWLPVSVGEQRLRTETAAMMSVQILKTTFKNLKR